MRYPAIQSTAARWMSLAFLAALIGVFLAREFELPGERLSMALRVTARWSFLWFFLASSCGALARIFGSRFQSLAMRSRDFGLTFASAHLAHVGLAGWLLLTSDKPFSRSLLVFFSVGVFFVYLLALLSVSAALRSALGPRMWRIVRTVGTEYIAFTFLAEFAVKSRQPGAANFLAYLPFVLLGLAGPLLRLVAFVKRSLESRGAGRMPRQISLP